MAYKRNKKEFFFPSVYMKMNWTFNYLKVMGRIQPIFWKKEREKKRKKENKNIYFHLFIFLYVYMKMN